ncbi:ubiquitin-conjugating enzyme E2 variant [Angomonas deanei]|uniref:B domain of TMEM189, localisation domain containing protein, putative n=1 Tax=Angomonas deanei TaxID=59799 RepID=S9W3Q4_9TRYP|nr:ubiquitin-conjugating enzyme E2 variant [Angomonas deanei]EPY35031.1 ubiquitin-conjugating enzyme E2 variant [Angomonas deanei]EPY38168.1 ubiquitin-conjugating enzyme E2 variant [Angomonas deanei]EPY38603.1 ubiquitin-conjugating enzyme E2 variant [Angomonas deanei]CAD2220858.1 B domain of TMEM189, localisation domain containing protein, putative [Angomonas deanei]|eukprot:EPY33991.1 ubiquitin-conjugating enzyme E2 variant [Angomonas deanei]
MSVKEPVQPPMDGPIVGDENVRKANAQKLKAGYTKQKRFLECCYLSLSTYLWFQNCVATGRYFVFGSDAKISVLVFMPIYILCAMALADLVSGLAHWGLDTWGTPDTPIFGNFIRSFREHHVDQTAMCKHDFIETNADTTLPLLPVLLLQYALIQYRTNNSGNNYAVNLHQGNIGVHVFCNTFFLFVALTNEIHKWSHQFKPAPLVKQMMDSGVVLSPIAHRKHHKDPFDCSYCITTGWLNPFLDAINFWRHLETVVTGLTGEIPRANDQNMLGK